MNKEQAELKYVEATKALVATDPNWYGVALSLLGAVYEANEHSVSEPDSDNEATDLAAIRAIANFADGYPDDWLPRVVRIALLVELSARRKEEQQ